MFKFGKIKVAKSRFYGTKKTIKICDVNFNNIVVSKLIEMKNSSKCLIGYLDEVIRTLVFILPKMSRYVKNFKVKDGDKDKNKNNKLKFSRKVDDKLLEKYKPFALRLKTYKISNCFTCL